ncbi:PH domain-containing protein [Clostridium perfringens]|nr:PH domain-containing protein [Clostridium perfringens]
MNKLYDEAIKKLNDDERPLGDLQCSILTFIYREVHRPGVLIATNKRVFFYGLNLGLEYTESFLYKDISSIEDKEGIFKEHIVMRVEGEKIKISNILSGNVDEFISIVRNNINMKKE